MSSLKPVEGYVHSIETLGALDGPGLRTVVFLQGCPLRCKFCHNVDCTLQDAGTSYSVDALVQKLLKNKAYWDQYSSKDQIRGGVTISGGEPTYQSAFVFEVLSVLKQHGVHTAIDSCSVTSKHVIQQLIPVVDYWMLSIKHMDNEEHKTLTGSANKTILENILFLDEEITQFNAEHGTDKKIRLRFVVIPGITDSRTHITAVGKFAAQITNLDVLELLPYGTHGKEKWIKLYGAYPLEGVREATKDDLLKAQSVLSPFSVPLMI